MPVEDPKHVLERVFGYREFRRDQEPIIERLISGGNALVLMPTGAGKSLCYQIPAMIREGVGIVISPLIALMKDQVDGLRQAGVRAAYVNSSLTADEARDVEMGMTRGDYDLVYVAPERLSTQSFLRRLDETRIALFAIDEAHCVSQWGHDFRPEYRKLDLLQERFPSVPRIALTATADTPTQAEVAKHLGMGETDIFVSGFDRANIRYRVVSKSSARSQLLSFLSTHHRGDSGIVYCMSRAKVEKTAAWLQGEGIDALPYHAGLDQRLREKHQQEFVHRDRVVIVATIAFGMGIDKPDVRFVAHLDLPKSLEAYYQETGRAGRDGLPANAWMCYGYGDAVLIRQMVERSQAGEERKRVEHQKLSALLGYCETATCRRQVLLRYFGEDHSGGCGNCDTCLEPVETYDGTVHAQKALSNVYRTGQRFGASYLAAILIGEADERARRNGHDRISTFGVGGELDRNGWTSVYRQLVAAGALDVDSEHGGLSLSENARPLLSGERAVELRRDAKPVRGSGASRGKSGPSVQELIASPGDRDLFEVLRAARLELAREQGVPPYVIFHDRTLLEMVRGKPASLDELAGIAGVGATKLERYGQIFLDALSSAS